MRRSRERSSLAFTVWVFQRKATTVKKSNLSLPRNQQKDHLRELFRCAVARQTEVMVKNILGNGIDIPLLGLREASIEVTGEMHELFKDESYIISQCFLLSTSQVVIGPQVFAISTTLHSITSAPPNQFLHHSTTEHKSDAQK